MRQEVLPQAAPIADKAAAAAVPMAEISVAAPAAGSGGANTVPASDSEANAILSRAIGGITANRNLIANEDVNLLIGMLTGKVPITVAPKGGAPVDPAAGTIGNAVSKLANGTVIADFYLPYRISCDGRCVQYVLPNAAPSFTVTAACTAANGDASVTVNAKGGVPPYDVAIDGGAYQALSGALSLAAGDHAIMLRGADGAETQAQTVTIAPPLVIGEPDYASANGMYTGSATITGGTPPYKVNGVDASNAVVVTVPSPSGTDVSLTVTDSKGCTAVAKSSHTCPPPCTLPCAGIALNRGFKFWIPEAGDPETDPQDAYQISSIKVASFTVDSAPGKPVDLTTGAAKALTAPNTQLSAASFAALVKSWIKNLKALIAQTPDLVQAGKAQWLTFAYAAAAPGKVGTLSIEYFECLTFNIQLDVQYLVGPNKTAKTLSVAYTPDGTSIKMGDSAVKIPAFDGSKTDKCSDRPAPANLCPAPPAFTVQIQKPTARGGSVAATATVTGTIESPQFLWEAQDGTPPMANGQQFTAQFSTSGSKLISVTVYDKNGCSATASQTVSVG
jgi:hypothetical protein